VIAAGNFSSINITFKLAREMGFFMMDYYVPSILIVVISWVSFWLHQDASAPRIVLGKIYPDKISCHIVRCFAKISKKYFLEI